MAMPAIDSNGIYRIETIPPPDGEDSAYDAPTKVGALARGQVQDMFAEAIQNEKKRSDAPPVSGARPKVAVVEAAAVAAPLPSLADEADDADESNFEPTVHAAVEAKPQLPVLTPTYLPQTSYFDVIAPEPKPGFGIVHAAAIAAALGIAGLIASFVF